MPYTNNGRPKRTPKLSIDMTEFEVWSANKSIQRIHRQEEGSQEDAANNGGHWERHMVIPDGFGPGLDAWIDIRALMYVDQLSELLIVISELPGCDNLLILDFALWSDIMLTKLLFRERSAAGRDKDTEWSVVQSPPPDIH